MTSFADSSALVTLYADEPGYERVRASSHLVVAQLAHVEVPSPIWRSSASVNSTWTPPEC